MKKYIIITLVLSLATLAFGIERKWIYIPQPETPNYASYSFTADEVYKALTEKIKEKYPYAKVSSENCFIEWRDKENPDFVWNFEKDHWGEVIVKVVIYNK